MRNDMRPSTSVVALALAQAVLAAATLSQAKPPTKAECEKSIRAYLTAEEDDRAKQATTLFEKLARVAPLSAREAKDWRAKLLSFHKKGRRLETSGRNWFHEKEKRGLYYVGGDTKKPKGILFGLHGGGKGAGDANSAFGAYQSAANKFDFALVCPEVLVKSEHGWTTDGTEEWVLELVDAALRTFKVDPSRVFLAGHSMGGYGSWTLGAHHADRLAAIVPSAGAPTPIFDVNERTKIIDVEVGVIPSLRNLRAVIFQSTDDPQVPPAPNQAAVRLLAEAKERWGAYDFEYIEVNDRGHGFPKEGVDFLLEKVLKSERKPVPDRVTWQPALAWKRQFYWLYWDEPVIGALVVADLDRKSNTITITCDKDASGLRVLLDDRVVDMAKEVIVVLNGKEVYRAVPDRSLSQLVRTALHPDQDLMFESLVPPRT